MTNLEASVARTGVILAVDQGTSSTKTLTMDPSGRILSRALVSVSRQHPKPGWVEQDPIEIRDSVVKAMRDCTAELDHAVVGMGLSTQRESAVIWDAQTGQPLGPILGWQDRRTAGEARDLVDSGAGAMVTSKTGLIIDPMFSALKFKWLLDQVDPDRRRSRAGQIKAGTIDSWLVHCFSGAHRIEAGNASRTLLMNLDTLSWDEDLLLLFNIPRQVLPEIEASNAPIEVKPEFGLDGLQIRSVMGDSHSALYAHGIREPGQVKVTYGTGSSVMGLLGENGQISSGLVRTLAWQDNASHFAFEGNILSTGATAVWLSKVLNLSVDDLGELAGSVESSDNVNLVPAFAGLGAPWWDEQAEAALSGFNLGTTAAHIARAAFESTVLQIEDILTEAEKSTGNRIVQVLADGGPTSNSWLMQLQADLSQRKVRRSGVPDLSALGVAQMASIASGHSSFESHIAAQSATDEFEPNVPAKASTIRRQSWTRAVARTRWTPVNQPQNNNSQGSE